MTRAKKPAPTIDRDKILHLVGRQRAVAAKLQELSEELEATKEESEWLLDEILGCLADPDVPNLEDIRCEPEAAAAEKETRARIGAKPATPVPWGKVLAGMERRQ